MTKNPGSGTGKSASHMALVQLFDFSMSGRKFSAIQKKSASESVDFQNQNQVTSDFRLRKNILPTVVTSLNPSRIEVFIFLNRRTSLRKTLHCEANALNSSTLRWGRKMPSVAARSIKLRGTFWRDFGDAVENVNALKY